MIKIKANGIIRSSIISDKIQRNIIDNVINSLNDLKENENIVIKINNNGTINFFLKNKIFSKLDNFRSVYGVTNNHIYDENNYIVVASVEDLKKELSTDIINFDSINNDYENKKYHLIELLYFTSCILDNNYYLNILETVKKYLKYKGFEFTSHLSNDKDVYIYEINFLNECFMVSIEQSINITEDNKTEITEPVFKILED